MATLDDKILGEKLQYYYSSSDEDDKEEEEDDDRCCGGDEVDCEEKESPFSAGEDFTSGSATHVRFVLMCVSLGGLVVFCLLIVGGRKQILILAPSGIK